MRSSLGKFWGSALSRVRISWREAPRTVESVVSRLSQDLDGIKRRANSGILVPFLDIRAL